jgi:ketosteroid isomerase-like protein
MSQENVDLVRQLYAALNAHDTDGWSNFVDPDVELVDHMGAVGEEHVSGIETIRRQAEGWFETFPDFRANVGEFIDAGDRVICVTVWRGTGSASGLDYHQPAAEVYTLRDGRIVRAELGFPDKAAALEAVGVRE